MNITFVSDKGTHSQNEDVYLIKDNIFGVFDGATSLIKYFDDKGKSAGVLAAEIAKRNFSSGATNSLRSLAEKSGEEIRQEMLDKNIQVKDKAQLWQTSASVVRLNKSSLEYLQIGDSPILFVFKNGEIKVVNKEHDLETLNLWVKVAARGVKEIRKDERIAQQLLKNRREANITYGVLNGESEALNFLNEGSLSIDSIALILIFSDGFQIPQKNPESPHDYKKIVKMFRNGGLEEVKDFVRRIEASDPECRIYPRFNQYDDLTAIAIDLR